MPGSSLGADTGSDENDGVLDLRGLKCPLPALIARRHLAARVPGSVLTVVADDPMAVIDVPHMCRTEGFDVIEAIRDGDVARFKLARPK